MIQRRITNYKINNLFVLVDDIKVLSKIILKFRHLEYKKSVYIKPKTDQHKVTQNTHDQ